MNQRRQRACEKSRIALPDVTLATAATIDQCKAKGQWWQIVNCNNPAMLCATQILKLRDEISQCEITLIHEIMAGKQHHERGDKSRSIGGFNQN